MTSLSITDHSYPLFLESRVVCHILFCVLTADWLKTVPASVLLSVFVSPYVNHFWFFDISQSFSLSHYVKCFCFYFVSISCLRSLAVTSALSFFNPVWYTLVPLCIWMCRVRIVQLYISVCNHIIWDVPFERHACAPFRIWLRIIV